MRSLKEIIKEDLKEAQWVGEDGDAVAHCKTQIGAWKKIRALMRSDVGDIEAEEITLDHIGIGYVHQLHEDGTPFTDEDGNESWYVSVRKSPLQIWWFQP